MYEKFFGADGGYAIHGLAVFWLQGNGQNQYTVVGFIPNPVEFLTLPLRGHLWGIF